MNANYGSELHLLRWMGRHRDALIGKIKGSTGLVEVDFLPFPFSEGNSLYDAELTSLSFLTATEHSRANRVYCKSVKPHWDAVAVGRDDHGEKVHVLVEAKAHTEEIADEDKMKKHGGRSHDIIAGELDRTAFEITGDNGLGEVWMGRYYQLANRLYAQNALAKVGIKTFLVDIFFCGDRNPNGFCPKSSKEWHQAIEDEYRELHLNTLRAKEYITSRLEELFIDVISTKEA